MKKFELKSSLGTIGVLFMALLLLGSCNKNEAPSAPTNLTAEADGDCIHLSWKEVPYADHYRIKVGFHVRDEINNSLSGIFEVYLSDVSGTVYDDHFPFEGTNYYKIEAVNKYGSSSISEILCQYPENETVCLWPNPALDSLNVKTNNITRIKVLNFNGETLADLETNYNTYTLPLNEFDYGIYFIHIFSDYGETVKRVVIL